MNERLKLLRIHLKSSQEEIGNRLGVNKATISRLEKGINNLTEQMIKSICREFNVNEEWLRNGIDPMFLPTVNDELKQLAQKHTFTDMEYKFFYEYLKLDLDKRLAVVEFLENIMNSDASLIATEPNQTLISKEEKSVSELETEYQKALKSASEQAATVSNFTEEDEKKKAQ